MRAIILSYYLNYRFYLCLNINSSLKSFIVITLFLSIDDSLPCYFNLLHPTLVLFIDLLIV